MKRKINELYNITIFKLFEQYWSSGEASITRQLEYEINKVEDDHERYLYLSMLDHCLHSEPSAINKIKSINNFDIESIENVLEQIEKVYL